jgi:hypothetical protein
MSAIPPKAEIVKHCVCLGGHRLTIFCRTKQLNYGAAGADFYPDGRPRANSIVAG